MKTYKKPLNRSITIGCIIFIIALCLLLSIANFTLYRNYVYQDYREYIVEILNAAMSYIDCDDLKNCIETKQESEQYKETLLQLDNLMECFTDIHYLYAILPLNTEETGNVMSVLSAERYYDRYVDTEGNLYLGWISDDEFDSETAEQFFEIMNGDEVVFFEEKTEWGTDYTGAMSIKDSEGTGIATLAVDIDISFINGMITEYATVNICIIAAAGIIFICIFLLWSTRNITRPIRELEKSTGRFVDQNSDDRDVETLRFDVPEMRSDNEIKSLSKSIVKMTERMRNYISDIINAEKKAANLQELATRDALTGIKNKTAYDNEISRINEMMKNGETKVGLAIVDLNFLKRINDTYGHDKGDVAIKKLCQIICSVFQYSPVFRIGGDEFTIILQGRDFDNYEKLEIQLNETLKSLGADDNLEPWEKVSAAIGAAFYDGDKNIDSIFRRADYVMYDHKKEMNALRTE